MLDRSSTRICVASEEADRLFISLNIDVLDPPQLTIRRRAVWSGQSPGAQLRTVSMTIDDICWAPAVQRAGLSEILRIHDLRHTVASLPANAGVPMKAVGEPLGSLLDCGDNEQVLAPVSGSSEMSVVGVMLAGCQV